MATRVRIPFHLSEPSLLHLEPSEKLYFDAKGDPADVTYLVEWFPPSLISPAMPKGGLPVQGKSASNIHTASDKGGIGIIWTKIEGDVATIAPRPIQISKNKHFLEPFAWPVLGALLAISVLGVIYWISSKDSSDQG